LLAEEAVEWDMLRGKDQNRPVFSPRRKKGLNGASVSAGLEQGQEKRDGMAERTAWPLRTLAAN
jgi:hypothetical protein